VPYDVLSDAVTVLQCYVAGWNEPEDVGPDERASTALMIATCRTLAALVAAGYARTDEGGAYALVQQIRDFFGGSAALRQLEAVRGRDVDPDIVDALVALAPRVQAKLPEPAADQQRTSNGAPTG
jgi:hypothetical protein